MKAPAVCLIQQLALPLAPRTNGADSFVCWVPLPQQPPPPWHHHHHHQAHQAGRAHAREQLLVHASPSRPRRCSSSSSRDNLLMLAAPQHDMFVRAVTHTAGRSAARCSCCGATSTPRQPRSCLLCATRRVLQQQRRPQHRLQQRQQGGWRGGADELGGCCCCYSCYTPGLIRPAAWTPAGACRLRGANDGRGTACP
jgi:hypothetical protein